MATKTIAWATGGGNITLTYTGQGNGSITVASTENETFDDRSQSINIVTTSGSPEKAVSVLIKQQGKKYNVGDVFDFAYTGAVQQVTLPKGKYKLQCWGAQGGTSYGSSSGEGSKGGYSEGVITLTETTTFYIFVGGKGSRGSSSSLVNGGWNGGGASVGYSYYNSGGLYGESYPACGGGATDISTVTSSMSYSNGRTNRSSASLLARCIVAGGGAGGSYRYTYEEYTDTYTETVFQGSGILYYRNYNANNPYTSEAIGWPTLLEAGYTYTATTDVSGYVCIYKSGQWLAYTSYTPTVDTEAYFDVYSNDASMEGKYVTVTVTREVSTTSYYEDYSYSNKSQQGGGTSGKGQYPGTQSSGGNGNGDDGGFGYGGNQKTTGYRYCSGGGGGGWYGGGTAYSDSSSSYINYSGGGSGFVNTDNEAEHIPSGYTGLQLDSGTTTAGNTSHPSISGGTETGHSGNGHAKITVLDDPLKDYTILNYIQSNGSQYIDSGIVGKSGLSLKMDMSFVEVPIDSGIVASRTSSVRYYLAHYYSGWTYGYGNYYTSGVLANTNTRYKINTVLKSGTQKMSINGSVTGNATSSNTYNTGYNMYICALNNSGTPSGYSKIRIYSLKIYDSGTIVRNYIPVKNSSGVCGLFDLVTNHFFSSKTSSNFTGA